MLAVLTPAAGRDDPKPGQVRRAAAADVAKMEQEDRNYFRRDGPGTGRMIVEPDRQAVEEGLCRPGVEPPGVWRLGCAGVRGMGAGA
jgi:hypothetical protein